MHGSRPTHQPSMSIREEGQIAVSCGAESLGDDVKVPASSHTASHSLSGPSPSGPMIQIEEAN